MKQRTKGLIAGSVALTALATSSISYYEGRSLRAYQDIVNVWTICDGETKGVKPGDVATPAQCDAMLAKNLVTYEAGLDRCLVAPVPGVVKVQFLSWAYNVGVGAACSSTLVRKANAGDVRGACNELLKWDRAGGRKVRGLTVRREAENRACLGALS
jgi:lysozyme